MADEKGSGGLRARAARPSSLNVGAMRVQPSLRPIASGPATVRPRSPERAGFVPRPNAPKPLSKAAAPAPLNNPPPIPKRPPSISDSERSQVPTPKLNQSIRTTPRAEIPTVPAFQPRVAERIAAKPEATAEASTAAHSPPSPEPTVIAPIESVEQTQSSFSATANYPERRMPELPVRPEAAETVIVRRRTRRTSMSLLALAALFVGAAAMVLGATLFMRARARRVPAAAAISSPAPRAAKVELPHTVSTRTQSQTAPAAPVAPLPTPPEQPSRDSNESPQALAAVSDFASPDGSERKAPTCDALLSGGEAAAYDDAKIAYAQQRIGHRELVRGNWDAAQAAFCRAARWTGDSSNLKLDLSQFLLLRRDSGAAAQWAQSALSADANNTRALSLLGDALVRTGKLEEARRAWLAANKLSETDAAAIERLAQAELEEGQRALKKYDFSRAERYFRRALAFRPELVPALDGLSAALVKLGMRESAEVWSRRAQSKSTP